MLKLACMRIRCVTAIRLPMRRSSRDRRSSNIVCGTIDRKSTRLNSSHTEIYTLSLHDALPIYVEVGLHADPLRHGDPFADAQVESRQAIVEHCLWDDRSEERRVGKECRSRCDWSSDVCSSDLC